MRRTLTTLLIILGLGIAIHTGWNYVAHKQVEDALSSVAHIQPTEVRGVPPDLPPEQNAATHYAKAVELARAVSAFEDVYLNPRSRDTSGARSYTSEAVFLALDEFEEALARLGTGALQSECVFTAPPVHGHESESYARGNLAFDLLDLSQILTVRAMARAESNDLDGAVQDLVTLGAMASHLTRQTTEGRDFLFIMTGHLMARSHTVACFEVLPSSSTPLATLERIGSPEVGSLAGNLISDEVAFLRKHVAPSTQTLVDSFEGASFTLGRLPRILERSILILAEPYLAHGVAESLAALEELDRYRTLPYPEAVSKMSECGKRLKEDGSFITSMIIAPKSLAMTGEGITRSEKALLRLGGKLLEERRNTGRYPETLASLEDPDLIRDPWSGGNFEMSREGDALVIRSAVQTKVEWRLPL